MDNLLGTGGATASRLTLPQKIIATGMSVILAFGLSPIGQAPAYAQNEEVQELSAQALLTYNVGTAAGNYSLGIDSGDAVPAAAQGETAAVPATAPIKTSLEGVAQGDYVYIDAEADPGYRLAGVSCSYQVGEAEAVDVAVNNAVEGAGCDYYFVVADDVPEGAVFTVAANVIEQVTVTAEAGSNGKIVVKKGTEKIIDTSEALSSATIDKDSDVKIDASGDTYYVVDELLVDGAAIDNPTTLSISDNALIEASFAHEKFDLTIPAKPECGSLIVEVNGKTITAADEAQIESVAWGDPVKVTATPDAGYAITAGSLKVGTVAAENGVAVDMPTAASVVAVAFEAQGAVQPVQSATIDYAVATGLEYTGNDINVFSKLKATVKDAQSTNTPDKTYDVTPSMLSHKVDGTSVAGPALYYAKSSDATQPDTTKPVDVADLGTNGLPWHAGKYVLVSDGVTINEKAYEAALSVPFEIAAYDTATHGTAMTFTPTTSQIEYSGNTADFLGLANKADTVFAMAAPTDSSTPLSDEAKAAAKKTLAVDKAFQTAVEPKKYDVPVTVTGDIAGTATMKVEITQTILRNSNIKVNGTSLTVGTPAEEAAALSVIDNAEAKILAVQSAGQTKNPVESLVIGGVTLELGKDYEVAYIDQSDATNTEMTEVPTAVGMYKVRLKTVAGSSRLNEYGVIPNGAYNALKLANTTYDIENWQVTDSSKSFKALGVAAATVDGGTYAGAEKAVEATNVKLTDAYGHDLTALVDGHYTVTYVPWTAQMERDYLGTEVFAATYPDYDHPYVNTNILDKDDNPVFYKGKPVKAGDYGVIIKSTSKDVNWEDTKDAAANTVGCAVSSADDEWYWDYGTGEGGIYDQAKLVKMTVKPVTVVEGTAAGQVTIAPYRTGAWTADYSAYREVDIYADGTAHLDGLEDITTVEYVMDPSATEEKDRAEAISSDYYSVSIESTSGATLVDEKPLPVGKYVATFEFSGNFTGKVTASTQLSINAFDLSKYLTAIPLADGTLFTGNEITPADVVRDNGSVVMADLVDDTSNDDADEAAELNAWMDYKTDKVSAIEFMFALPTIWAIGKDDVTWTGVPYAPKAVYSDYALTVKGQGNYAGSVPSATLGEGKNFVVNARDLSTTKLQFRNPGEVLWADAADGTFAVALDATTGVAIPPESRLLVTATEGAKSELVIPTAAYSLTYENNKTANKDATATIKANESLTGEDITATYKVVGADQTPAGQGYSIEFSKGDKATYNGKTQDPGLKVYQTVDGTKVEADSTTYDVSWAKDGKAYTPAADENGAFTDAATYTAAVTFKKTSQTKLLAGSLVATYTIDPLAITQADVQSEYSDTGLCIVIPDVNFGDAEYADFAVYLNGNDITNTWTEIPTDGSKLNGYYVSWKELKCDAVGEHTANFEFGGNITGKVTQKFNVKAEDITEYFATGAYQLYIDGKTTFKGANKDLAYEYNFDGLAKSPVVTLVHNGKQVADDSQMRIDIVGDTTNVGKFTVNVLFTGGNFQGTASVACKINPVDIGEANKAITCTFTDEETAYTGKPVQPKGTLTLKNTGEGYTLVEGKDYQIKYEGEAINVGDKGTVIYEALSTGNFWTGDGTRTEEFTVTKAQPKDQEIVASDMTMTYGDAPKAIGAKAQTDLTYTPDNSGVVSVDAKGNVTALKAGTAKVKITAAETAEYKAAEKEITVTVAKAKNTLKIAKATRTAKGVSKKNVKVKGAKVKNKGQGTITWKKVKVNKSGAKFKVNKKNGKITVKKGTKAGTYKVTVKAKAKGDANHKASAWKKAVVKVKVKA